VWLQNPRKVRDDGEPMQLHWDGNNTPWKNVIAARRSARAHAATIDMAAIGRIEQWLSTLEPPKYPLSLIKRWLPKATHLR